MTSAVLRREHEIPQFAGIAALAVILARENADEILQAHVFQPMHGLHHEMMALAPQQASGHQDQLRVRLDAEGAADRFHALRRDRVRIEALQIDAQGTTLMRPQEIP